MKKYCYIENNKIVLVNQDLPKVWKNVSGFDNLPDSILKNYGWLPIILESEEKQILVSLNYVIEEDFVREIKVTRDKSEQELEQENNQQLQDKWIEVRTQRDELLKASDILVLIDRWEILSEEERNQIKIYRQSLRDLPNNFSSPYEIIWPKL